MAQPGIGFDVNLWRGLALRVATDVPVFVGTDYVVSRPRLTGRVVVGF